MTNEKAMSNALVELAGTVVAVYPVLDAVETLVGVLGDVVRIDASGVMLVAGDGGLEPFASSNAMAQRFQRMQKGCGEGPSMSALGSGRQVSIPDLRDDRRFPSFSASAVDAGLGSVFSFPLRDGSRTIGTIDLYRTGVGPLDEADRLAVATLSKVVTAYIVCARARQRADASATRFENISLHDPLTGLGNRRLLLERIHHAGQRSKRTETMAAVLFIDLDRFKNVNDDFGHHVGDELLVSVADRLRELMRLEDTLARISGDEFVIFCESLSSPSDAELLKARIERSLAKPFTLRSHTVSVSASVGVALARPGDSIEERLIVQADASMYDEKRRAAAPHLAAAE